MLYKGKYAICIYEKGGDETLLTMFENTQQFAKKLNLSMHQATDLLAKHFNKKISSNFVYDKKYATLEFVRLD